MSKKQEAKNQLLLLIERFGTNVESYKKRGDYNEARIRIDYINPFFEALGWDISNQKGLPESYREVISEDKVKVGKETKAPDYCFTIDGKKKFFVEAKQPSVILKSDTKPAYQLRRYGYSAGMPISLLTDFEELAIYDCLPQPLVTDGAATARLKYLTFEDYEKEFDFIWEVFAKENVENGSFEQFAQQAKIHKGSAGVDSDFLFSLNTWREDLAVDIAKENPTIDEDEINFALQKTLDRIIFLRICESKGLEIYGKLRTAIETENSNYYENLLFQFRDADKKYNSGLFDLDPKSEKSDKLTTTLKISNLVLKNIISNLYFPSSPYEFSVIPVEILGNVYEQFLGKTIQIDNKHKIKIDEKPEVRKAGGVYYTPQYIVNYIVTGTVGKLIEGKTPEQISKISICDPACGSGSFLLGAYQCLLDYHLRYYTNQKTKSKDVLTPDQRLTTKEKKRILLNNIYGVDIDTNAVEVSKLSLMLKALENETEVSVRQSLLFNERILPSLDSNIKSGNSLIDLDFYDGQIDFDPQVEKKIKPFNWQQKFPEVFKKGGFDAIIGNPPYVKEYTSKETFEQIKQSHIKKYYQGKMDLWYFFACHALDLLREKGTFGFIVPNNWVTNSGASILRNKIVNDAKLIEMIDFGSFMVFRDASIQTMLLIAEKNQKDYDYTFDNLKMVDKNILLNDVLDLLAKRENKKINFIKPQMQRALYKDKFLTFENDRRESLLAKIQEKGNFVLDEKEVANGIHPHYDFISKAIAEKHNNKFSVGDGIFGLSEAQKNSIDFIEIELDLIKPYYTTEQLSRYYGYSKNKLWLIYTDSKFKNPVSIVPYPNLKNHLDQFKDVITSDNKPYGLHRARDERFFKGEKIIALRKCPNRPVFTYTDFDCYVSATFYIIKTNRLNNKYLTALLNSKLVAFWLKYKGKMQGNNYQIDKEPLLQIPIYAPNQKDKTEKALHDQIISAVDSLLKLYEQISTFTLVSQKETAQDKIYYLEKQIDKWVFDLYGFSETERAVIRESL